MARFLSLVFCVVAAMLVAMAASETYPVPAFGCGIVRMLDPDHLSDPYGRYSEIKPIDYEHPGHGYFGRPYYQSKQIYGGW